MNAKDGTAVLDTPMRSRALNPEIDGPKQMPGPPTLRRDPVPDLRQESDRRNKLGRRASDKDPYAEDPVPSRRAPAWRLRLRGTLPSTWFGRAAAGVAVLFAFSGVAFGFYHAHALLLRDERLTIPSSKSIEIAGNKHLSRAQLLSVFGEDVDRNLFTVPLDSRRAELEALPWVEHATVMRLLPNKVRVSIVERTPVAFVRQGSTIGLVDDHGVLLDMAPDSTANHAYSFPVVTGIASTDPATTRAARMKLYQRFVGDLDSGSEKISKKLSEIDLTDPEDVKALIADNRADVLVHFGDDDFLTRYQRYEQNLDDWKTKYPKLASVDMRYEREVVLEMAPGAAASNAGNAADHTPADRGPSNPGPIPTPAKASPAVPKKPLTANSPAVKRPTAKQSTAAPAKHLQQAPPTKTKAVSR